MTTATEAKQEAAEETRDEAEALWRFFLDGITGGDEMKQKILQRFAGYVLSAHCSYRKFLVLEGYGMTGKSTFARTLAAALGEGSTLVADPADLLLMSFQHRLVGRRLLVLSEWSRPVMKAPSLLRMIDGNCEVREEYSKGWQWFTGKIIITHNTMTDLLIADDQVLSRMIVVQLHRIWDPDPHMAERLASPAVRNVIFAWAQAGAVDLATIPNNTLNPFIRREEPCLNERPLIV